MVRRACIVDWLRILTVTATSNDPWGPVGSDMAEIAQITFNK
jgi:epsin